MPDLLSAADIAEGRRLDGAATPSPWDTDPHSHLEKGCRRLCCHDNPTVTHTTNMLYCEDIPVPDGADQTRCDQAGYTWTDAELIVWMRNHLPALLDAAEKAARLEATIAEFINQRVEYVNACRNANADHDYYRWQGGAEARRQLAQRLGWTVPYESGDKTTPKTEETDSDAQ